MQNFIIINLFGLFLLVSEAHAYLDPGTGSIILQAILAFIAGCLSTISLWWGNFKNFFKKFLKLNKQNEKIDKNLDD